MSVHHDPHYWERRSHWRAQSVGATHDHGPDWCHLETWGEPSGIFIGGRLSPITAGSLGVGSELYRQHRRRGQERVPRSCLLCSPTEPPGRTPRGAGWS